MSLDKSLKSRGALVRHRNVLSRTERISAMKEEERWPEGRTVFGLPKVAHRKVVTKKPKAAAKPAVEGVPAEGAPPAEGAAPAESAAPKTKSKA